MREPDTVIVDHRFRPAARVLEAIVSADLLEQVRGAFLRSEHREREHRIRVTRITVSWDACLACVNSAVIGIFALIETIVQPKP